MMTTIKQQRTKIEKLLLEAGRRFNSTLDYEELIQMVLQMIASAVNAEGALVFRVDHNRTNMRIRFMNALTDSKMRIFYRELGQGVVGWVAEYKEPVIINNVTEDSRIDAEMWKNVDLDMRSLISIPLIGRGHMIGVIEAINKIDGEFTDTDLDILIGLGNQIAVAIDNANLYRRAKREALEKSLLYEIGKKLSSTLSLDQVLKEIVNALMQAVDFKCGGVFIINPEREEVDSVYVVGYDTQAEADIHLKFGQGLVGQVARTGKPIIVPDVSKDQNYIHLNSQTRSEMVVPIELNGKIIGVFNVESVELNAYDDEALALVSTFATQAAVSIERARLHEQVVANQGLLQQLNIARQIQKSFLPKADLKLKGYDISGINVSSGQVGGDYYDFIRIVEQQTGIAIGDVSGKGIPAALLMASFRASLIAEIRNNYSIRTICHKVNRLLCESMDPGNFVTAVYGVLDSKNHVLTFSNCGHNLPVLLRDNGTIEYLREGGPVMGVTPNAEYEERPLYLGTGDVVVLYTDGVVEVFDSSGEEFGLDRLIDVIKANRLKSASEIQDAIRKAATAFASPTHVFDDLTMIVLKRTA